MITLGRTLDLILMSLLLLTRNFATETTYSILGGVLMLTVHGLSETREQHDEQQIYIAVREKLVLNSEINSNGCPLHVCTSHD